MTTEPATAARIYIGASSWVDKSLVASERCYPRIGRLDRNDQAVTFSVG